MAVTGKAATGALNTTYSDTLRELAANVVASASSAISVGHSVEFILSQIVDDDGTVRTVVV